MTSFRQFEANRRNALLSTGPKTKEGKRHSRLKCGPPWFNSRDCRREPRRCRGLQSV